MALVVFGSDGFMEVYFPEDNAKEVQDYYGNP